MLIPFIGSAMRICRIGGKLKKRRYVSRQRIYFCYGLLFIKVETNFWTARAVENWIRKAFYLKDNNKGHGILELVFVAFLLKHL